MLGKEDDSRPLSPHLTIYRPQFTSVMSILHRITGVSLGASVLLIVGWFVALALGENYFNIFHLLMGNWFIKLVLLLSLWAFWYHFFAGLRHLIWDWGYGLEFRTVKISALLVLFFSTLCFFSTIFLVVRI
jgi:succinate dehydrogenase / fumarate reductase cytochrome b subunit